MEYKKVSNESGLSVVILYRTQMEYYTFFGGNSDNPSWQEYLDDFKDEYKPHVLLLKKCIEENELVGCKGEEAENFSFKFDDGEHWGFTWRAWGDLMSAIVDKREGYMAYYM